MLERVASAEKQAAEGRKVCIDIIQEVREIKGVSGIHMMAYRQEDSVPEIIERSGVLGGRVPWYPGVGESSPVQATRKGSAGPIPTSATPPLTA